MLVFEEQMQQFVTDYEKSFEASDVSATFYNVALVYNSGALSRNDAYFFEVSYRKFREGEVLTLNEIDRLDAMGSELEYNEHLEDFFNDYL